MDSGFVVRGGCCHHPWHRCGDHQTMVMPADQIEALLTKSALALRDLQKAAKDQAARDTAEPTEPTRRQGGDVDVPRPPTIQPR